MLFRSPPTAPIEGGSASTGDRHVLVVDAGTCELFETYNSKPQGGGSSWTADSGARFDLRSNALRPAGWTSGDAAGLAMLPGLVRYDEVATGRIDHALRVTVPATSRSYLWPARHQAGSTTDPNVVPMGAWLRLKPSVDLKRFTGAARVVVETLARQGGIVADNGSAWYVSGAPDPRWNNDNLHTLDVLTGDDFEFVDAAPLQVSANSGQVRSALPNPGHYLAYNPSRLLDTRTPIGSHKARLNPGETVEVSIASPGSPVTAVALNVTLVAPSADTWVTAYPAGTGKPAVSSVNAGRGAVVANLVIARVGANGNVAFTNAGGATDLVVDKAGEIRLDSGAGLVTLAPVRLVDTRSPAIARPLGADTVRDVTVVGAGLVPPGARAAVLNVTAVSPTEDGWLSLWPAGSAHETASSLNFAARQTVPNLVIAQVGAGGAVSIHNPRGSTHLVIDLLGYFDPNVGRAYLPLNPTRLADTRGNNPTAGTWTKQCDTANSGPCTVEVQLTGRAGVPSDATVIAVNVTATNSSFPSYLTVGAAPTLPAATSNLNFSAGQSVANTVITNLSPQGTIRIVNPAGFTHVIVDLAGYFPAAPS